MSHPLLSGQTKATQFQARSQVPPYPVGQCATSLEDLQKWLTQMSIRVSADGKLFGYTAGTMEAATTTDRDLPRFMFDNEGRFLGLALWMPEAQGWTVPGQVGQLITLRRIATTIEADIAARPLAGWKLCDGTTPSLPNLSTKSTLDVTFATPSNGSATVEMPSPWFAGASPNWDTYTMGYVGV